MANVLGTLCSYCLKPTHTPLCDVSTSMASKMVANQEEGFVKSTIDYLVMDNLEVRHASNISTITHLKISDVGSIGCLEEKMADIDLKEGFEILRTSLQSKAALSKVFLPSNVVLSCCAKLF
ncbi:hypothetical protein GIB67_014196 [Kingdonia uniflora]|uniref:Uncharacterized protein n=1 Tax=Kingdonia uniflora TaxID=39325 RepID=A0A7J7M1S2_9MAGN|nr:hypothetical protein GIB67_014196 [Kingdonia uniflora]